MSEEEKKEVAEKKEEKKEEVNLASFLKKHPNAPGQEVIEAWKQEHGEIFLSGFGEEELFIFRPVTRPEWVNLQQLASDPQNEVNQFKFEEMLCDNCVLWKSVKAGWNEGKAGTPTSLQEQILQNSNFVSPAAASMLVMKL